jgi:hypothetical protein
MTQRLFWDLGMKSKKEIKELLAKKTLIEKFIEKWNVGYEDFEQKKVFAKEMKSDLKRLIEAEIYRYNHE